MSISAQERWARRILRADRNEVERIRDDLQEQQDAETDVVKHERLGGLIDRCDQRSAKFAAEHADYMGLGA